LNKRRVLCRRVVEEQWTLTKAAEAAEVERALRAQVGGALSRRRRARAVRSAVGGGDGRQPHCERSTEAIAALRRLRFTGPEIAELLGMALSTVSGILTRIGMGKLGRLGFEPAERYERARPGELIHIDVKKLGRIARPGHRVLGRQSAGGQHRRSYEHGWEFVHIAIDDCTRLAYVEVLDDEGDHRDRVFASCDRVLPRHGITCERLITDNGPAYRSTIHAIACRRLGIRHLRTRPYRPQTNGKAERFIRTLLGGWSYGALYRNSTERTAALDAWIDYYG
jgi:transposase InsO family protein